VRIIFRRYGRITASPAEYSDRIDRSVQFQRGFKDPLRFVAAVARRASAVREGTAKLIAPIGFDLADIPDRTQFEVQRAIQRSIKGVEYISSSGPTVGSTPKDILKARGTMNLYHYRPLADEIYRVPILIVMATTNRGYILDMLPGQSFIEFLLKRGYDVYMLDWTPPGPEERSLRLGDYVLDFIPDCIRHIQQDSGETDVSVIGYCFGGVLSLLYGSIFPDGPMKNLVCFTTPIDFRELKLFANLADRRYFDVDRLVDSVGNVPPDMISQSFDMLRPSAKVMGQVQLWEKMWDDEYVKSYRMFDRWATDILPLAGEYFRDTTKDLFWDNKLFNDTMSVGGRPAIISKIKVPVLHAIAEHDHIVPYDAAKHLIAKVGSTDKEEVMLKGGHVSLIAGPNAVKRLWPKLDNWLGGRSI
jgi:polyhydroxyalkanoate synthase